MSSLWQAASRAVAPLDRQFSEACYFKALGWLTPQEWDRADKLGVKTDLEFIKSERVKLIKSAKVQPTPTPAENSDHLVILIHGFNTFAKWMDDVKEVLREQGFAAEATGFGYFGFVRFLSFPACRNYAAKRVTTDIDFAILKYQDEHNGQRPKKISAIAHSFGSWLLMKILKDNPRYKLYRIIFCGSILREDFNFMELYERGQLLKVVNYIGTRDYWPAGESAGWGYGSIGSRGLLSPAADNRWHADFEHSDFLTPAFCKAAWIPFLEGNDPSRGDKWKELPFWVRAITFVPLRWIILSVAIVAPLLVGQFLSLKLLGINAAGEIKEFIENRFVPATTLPKPDIPTVGPQTQRTAQIPSPPAPPARPVNGVWDVVMVCLQGSTVNEYGALFNLGRYARGFQSNTVSGMTELALGYLTDDTVKLTGYVVFGQADVYTIDASAKRNGTSFSGKGQFGSSVNCSVNITAKN